MYLHSGLTRFARAHDIEARQFVVCKYDGHDMLTIKILDETMRRRHYHFDEDE
jgi:hypothetical protein